jgi:hypothetical protein
MTALLSSCVPAGSSSSGGGQAPASTVEHSDTAYSSGDGRVTIDAPAFGGAVTFEIRDSDESVVEGAEAAVLQHGDLLFLSFSKPGYLPVGAVVDLARKTWTASAGRAEKADLLDDQIEAAQHAMKSLMEGFLLELLKGSDLAGYVPPIKIIKSGLSLVSLLQSDSVGYYPTDSMLDLLTYRGTASLRDVRDILGVSGVFTLFIPEPTVSKIVSAVLLGGSLVIDGLGIAGVDLDQPYDWFNLPGTAMYWMLPSNRIPPTTGITLWGEFVDPPEAVYGVEMSLVPGVTAYHPDGASHVSKVQVTFLTPTGELHDVNVFDLFDDGAAGDAWAGDDIYATLIEKNPYAYEGVWTVLFSAEDDTGRGAESRKTYFTIWPQLLPESPHPYPNYYDQEWSHSLDGYPLSLDVTFDPATRTEYGWDYIHVMDAYGTPIAGSPFHGTQLAGATVNVPGSTVRIRLTSDSTITDWGFRVTAVEPRN